MTALHDRARKLAIELVEGFREVGDEGGVEYWPDNEKIADAMVQLARDFASDALYEFCDIIDASGTQRGELAAAVAAAEKGSTDE